MNNRDAGTIDDGGNVTFSIEGALSTAGDASFVVSGRNDSGAGGGTIGTGGAVTVSAGSISVGGAFNAGMGISGGKTNQALDLVSVSGALTTGTDLIMDIQNGGANASNAAISGGAIATNALLSLDAGRVTAGGLLDVFLNNLNGGTIADSAIQLQRHKCTHRADGRYVRALQRPYLDRIHLAFHDWNRCRSLCRGRKLFRGIAHRAVSQSGWRYDWRTCGRRLFGGRGAFNHGRRHLPHRKYRRRTGLEVVTLAATP